ncbi:hypothetical protein FRC03_003274 [Tulasnella sp. 419]|nr:hypothetical protein FRC03_003274 [Tulasnella sp. 419]
MSLQTDIVNEANQHAPAAYDIIPILCNQCHNRKHPSEFGMKTRGSGKGTQHAASCQSCTEKRKEKQSKRKQENLDALPVLDLAEFLCYLEGFAAGHSMDCNVEGRVKTDGLPKGDGKLIADDIAEAVSEATGYRYIYNNKHIHSNPSIISYRYNCAQVQHRQKKPRKVPDPTKRRDKQPMETFDCQGMTTIVVDSENIGAVNVTVTHLMDHIPYCHIYLPEEIKELVMNSLDKTPNQIWKDICHKNPNPAFSRKQVYQLWHSTVQKQWTMDADELTSARKLILEKGKEPGGLGPFRFEEIPISAVAGFDVLAFSVPAILEQWKGRMREVLIDSCWGTNRAGCELFTLLGEAYGSGLPLGYIFIKSTGEGEENAKRGILEQFLKYFRDEWKLEVKFTLSDKDKSEIGACCCVFPEGKHQLCFWHCLRAIKTRLSILRRQPAYYNITQATQEFDFIEHDFLPLAQQSINAPDIIPSQKPVPRVVIRLGNQETEPKPPASTSVTKRTEVKPEPQPLTIRLCGHVIKITGYRQQSKDNELGDEESKDNELGDEDGSVDDEEASGAGSASDEEDRTNSDLVARVEREIRRCEQDLEEEDAPDWQFDDGETKSKDANYVFCPAPHRAATLHLFTRHFVRHPVFLHRLDTKPQTAASIRIAAVKEMYFHCKRNGLAEVWAYMWTQWYSPRQWQLWSRSTSPYLSRLRTTMTVENHWKRLKHHYLTFTLRPRLDHCVYVICTESIPAIISAAFALEDTYRQGRAKPLTTFQKAFKTSWRKKAMMKIGDKKYETSVDKWQCNCGAQELDTHHLCKHLVQAVPTPPPSFFNEVVRRRSVPLYRHPHLHPHDSPVGDYTKPTEGSITDGDDHEGIGGRLLLENGAGGWSQVVSGVAKESMLKRKRMVEEVGAVSREDAEVSTNRQRLEIETETEDKGIEGDNEYEAAEDDDAEENELVEAGLKDLMDDFEAVAKLIRNQLPYKNHLWMKNIRRTLGGNVHSKVKEVLEHVNRHENGGVGTTWPRNRAEQRSSKHTMGYQLRPSSPEYISSS